jgi:hypothetical protein
MNSDPGYVDYVDPTYLTYCDDEEYDAPRDGRGFAAAHVTSLDPSQSTVIDSAEPLTGTDANRKDTLYRFRRPDHWHAYTRTLAALGMRHSTEKQHRRLALCGAHATVWHSPSTDQIRVQAYHCGLRCCPRCREMHASRTRTTLGRFLANVPRNRLSMITLTTAHSALPLCEQIDGLYASFRRLRASEIWQDNRPKGYAVLEITYNVERCEWHPHLHLLAETPYMPHAALRDAWTTATKGTASIVDIRRVNRHAVEKCQHYLTDYLTKPAALEILDSKPLLTEWIDGLFHRKVLIRFGRPKLADEPERKPDPKDWSLIGSLIGLMAGLARHNSRAAYWLSRLGQDHVTETRDVDAGKDYSLCSEYRSPNEQFF